MAGTVHSPEASQGRVSSSRDKDLTLCNDIVDRHGKDEPVEGEDYFFDYATRRSGRTIALKVKVDGEVAFPTMDAYSP
jgi:hypothetical protein